MDKQKTPLFQHKGVKGKNILIMNELADQGFNEGYTVIKIFLAKLYTVSAVDENIKDRRPKITAIYLYEEISLPQQEARLLLCRCMGGHFLRRKAEIPGKCRKCKVNFFPFRRIATIYFILFRNSLKKRANA
jgi:hypothetical protein